MSSERPDMKTIALAWRTSSYSGTNGGECVEIAFDGDTVLIRDSKYLRDPSNDPAAQPVISIPAQEWNAFKDAAAGTEADDARGLPLIERLSSGEVRIQTDGGIALTYTAAEWVAFTAGICDGEFELATV
ncbi:DUF397 domain-containing protein [Nocardia sp. NPDC049149]|uniref:DUF397 domain-containing protein n=1 Tax=Nocardia sp. NPDC049149 TaxID=3364315 RepID=UPI003721F376